ncbi:helix-turn-helix domain-containing protein [Massilia oculi]|uniref:helix-turn-helix domain-containing protein n=1 Tax=Massilia oculi TaxID=945844 RepID=UPI0013B3CA47|nr:helix-turn-helix domain-containing protein [Massilia oculi]
MIHTSPPQLPPTAAERRGAKLQAAILAALAVSSRTTRALYTALDLPRAEVYRMLKQMQEAGAVQNRTDRRTGEDGQIIGATWVLTGQPLPPRSDKRRKSRAKPPAPPKPFTVPPRDPLLWAMFGGRP